MLAPSFSGFDSSGSVLPGVYQSYCLSCNIQHVTQLCDRIVRAAECVTSEKLASTWRETEYCLDGCRATNGAILRPAEHIRNFVRPTV
jgi:hypothetical protein